MTEPTTSHNEIETTYAEESQTLDALMRAGAQPMLMVALEAAVEACIWADSVHFNVRLEDDRLATAFDNISVLRCDGSSPSLLIPVIEYMEREGLKTVLSGGLICGS